MAVNVSVLSFRNPGFVAAVHGILDENWIGTSLLEIELTEGVLIRDVESTFVCSTNSKASAYDFAMG